MHTLYKITVTNIGNAELCGFSLSQMCKCNKDGYDKLFRKSKFPTEILA